MVEVRPQGVGTRKGGSRGAMWVRNRKSFLALVPAACLLFAMAACGCGGEETVQKPTLEEAMRSTLEGWYQVKALEDGKVLGVGICGGGSYRIVVEGVPRVVIYNRDLEQGWMVNLQRRTYREIDAEEAGKRAGFLPGRVMEPYFELPAYWADGEFRMETMDGRLITARLDGPGGLPTLWEVKGPGGTTRRLEWEYRRVGEVSKDNFLLPEGLTPEE